MSELGWQRDKFKDCYINGLFERIRKSCELEKRSNEYIKLSRATGHSYRRISDGLRENLGILMSQSSVRRRYLRGIS